VTPPNTLRLGFAFALFILTACGQKEFDRRIKLGSEALHTNAYKEAADQFTLAVKARPDAEAGHLGLGAAYLNQYSPFDKASNPADLGKNADAEFRRALEINPKSARAMECLASLAYQQVYLKAGESFRPYLDLDPEKMDQARSWFEKALAADPADPVAHYGLGALDWERAESIRLTRFAQLKIDPWDHATPLKDAALRAELKAKTASLYESTAKEMKAVLDHDPLLLDAKKFQTAAATHQIELADTPADAARLTQERDAMIAELLKQLGAGGRTTPEPFSDIVRSDLPVTFAPLPPPPPPPAAPK
jgi:Tfp pilus assembly protein PilF